MPRVTPEQLEYLTQFLEANPELAISQVRCAHTRQLAKSKWEELAAVLNAMGGTTRDARGWTKVWSDKKYHLRRRVAKRSGELNTGVRIENLQPPLSDLDKRLLFVMGGYNFAESDQPVVYQISIPKDAEGQLLCQAPTPSVASTATQTSPIHTPIPKRRRVVPTQMTMKWQLLRIEAKRAEADAANAAGWRSVSEAINNLANSVIMCEETIIQALNTRR